MPRLMARTDSQKRRPARSLVEESCFMLRAFLSEGNVLAGTIVPHRRLGLRAAGILKMTPDGAATDMMKVTRRSVGQIQAIVDLLARSDSGFIRTQRRYRTGKVLGLAIPV